LGSIVGKHVIRSVTIGPLLASILLLYSGVYTQPQLSNFELRISNQLHLCRTPVPLLPVVSSKAVIFETTKAIAATSYLQWLVESAGNESTSLKDANGN
jgi:hypothetical protein